MRGRIEGYEGIACCPCGNDSFELPKDELSTDPIHCRCGVVLGTYLALASGFVNGYEHLPVSAVLKRWADDDPKKPFRFTPTL